MFNRPAADRWLVVRCATGRWPGILALALFLQIAAGSCGDAFGITRSLPAPVVNPRSTEISMNSRLSYHGSWSATLVDQMVADVCYATSRAPLTGGPLTIYVATAQNVYIYDPVTNSLVLHKAGDSRSDTSASFELGVAAGNMIDAGVAMHLALLESTAIWTGTASQLAACPRASATTYANSHWTPTSAVDIVTSFGVRTVRGFTDVLVAVSSDESLPNPAMDGTVYFDNVLEGLKYDSTFTATDLTLEQLSQILWASYGCSNHSASGKGGLVCASAVANYYLTRRIYSVSADGVYRYHDRRPPGTDMTTRDHRIELVTAGDARPALRTATPGLPDAPNYLVICLGTTGDWPELEVGFAAIGAVVEAATIGLGGGLEDGLTAQEQTAIRAATGIPSSDAPMAVVSLGHPSNSAGVEVRGTEGEGLRLSIGNRILSGDAATIRYLLPRDAAVDLTVYDCLGRPVRSLVTLDQAKGPHSVTWDARDNAGRPILSGVYFCRLLVGGAKKTAQVVVVR
jgi:hypothetical protein